MTGTWMRRALGAAVAAMGLVAVGVAAPGPAGAGGGEWMYPVRDRYEPGQDVLMVGYSQTAHPQSAAAPYYAWLRVDPAAEARAAAADHVYVYVDPTDIRLTPVVIDDTPVDGYHGRRATISFTLPSDLPRGQYQLILCNDPCTAAPGYLIPETLSVGVSPPYEVIRDWPATEPAIRWLEDDALLFGPNGQTVTAADYRAGRFPPPVTLPPSEAPSAPATTVTPGPSRVAGEARSRVPGEAPTTTRAAGVEADPTAASGGAGGAARDEGWAPLGAWLGGLAALALASGALVARGQRARRAAPPSDAATAEGPGTVPNAPTAGGPGTVRDAGAAVEPGEPAEGAEGPALIRT